MWRNLSASGRQDVLSFREDYIGTERALAAAGYGGCLLNEPVFIFAEIDD